MNANSEMKFAYYGKSQQAHHCSGIHRIQAINGHSIEHHFIWVRRKRVNGLRHTNLILKTNKYLINKVRGNTTQWDYTKCN